MTFEEAKCKRAAIIINQSSTHHFISHVLKCNGCTESRDVDVLAGRVAPIGDERVALVVDYRERIDSLCCA